MAKENSSEYKRGGLKETKKSQRTSAGFSNHAKIGVEKDCWGHSSGKEVGEMKEITGVCTNRLQQPRIGTGMGKDSLVRAVILSLSQKKWAGSQRIRRLGENGGAMTLAGTRKKDGKDKWNPEIVRETMAGRPSGEKKTQV